MTALKRLKFKMIETVLAYLVNKDEVLLLYRNKKKNDINEGKWIGVGGHIEIGESPSDALIREVKEETNLDVITFTKRGEILFINNDFKEIMHLYVVNEYKGDIKECDEGELRYFKIKDIFSLPMWEGDKIFLDKLFNTDEVFSLTLTYNGNKLIKSEFH